MRGLFIAGLLCISVAASAQSYSIALLKYNGGGDWYANPTSLGNLVAYADKYAGMDIDSEPATVEVGSRDLFNYPFAHMTGHGNVVFSDAEAENLRKWLMAGGFLRIDDNYGMDPYIRPALKKVFPDQELTELPFSHPIFHQLYNFNGGLPKIHEHDGKPPQAFGLFYEGRLVCLYTFECDLGDGWEDPDVHNDPEPVRQKALQMGVNILQFVFTAI